MFGESALSLVLQAGPLVKVILLVLLFFSIITWAIIVYKYRYLSRLEKETDQFKRLFSKNRSNEIFYQMARSFAENPYANLFNIVITENQLPKENVKIELKRIVYVESTRIERFQNFLATTGSTAPFIGLFGTVWGIMDSFRGIGKTGSASLATVAPGIAEALIATAAGLAAAIPAVMAFNYFQGKVRRHITELEDFSQELYEIYVEGKSAATQERSSSI